MSDKKPSEPVKYEVLDKQGNVLRRGVGPRRDVEPMIEKSGGLRRVGHSNKPIWTPPVPTPTPAPMEKAGQGEARQDKTRRTGRRKQDR